MIIERNVVGFGLGTCDFEMMVCNLLSDTNVEA